MDTALKVSGASARFIAPYSVAAMPARYVVERNDWQGAARLEVVPTTYPYVSAITHYARALGAARSGDIGAAKSSAEQLAAAQAALEAAKNKYWATEVEIQRLGAAGWIALAEGKDEEALKFMRASADLEDRNEKHIVTPGRLLPARELLGEMLLQMKQPAAALKELEASQVREPNRFRNYALSARAAEAAGDTATARKYYEKLSALANDPAADRPELKRAKMVLGSR
jgi:predicted Zn-dependent protease